MRPEFERVQNLLSDTVTLLCKNGLTYDKEMKVQGLLGITLDEKDVFVVHFNELFSQAVAASIVPEEESDSESEEEAIIIPSKNHTNSPNNRAAKRSHRDSSVDLVQIKTESDDVILLDPKKEPGGHGINNDYGPSSKRRLIENPATIQSPTLPGDTPNYMSAVSRHSENSNTSWDGTQPPNIHIAGVSSLGTNSNMPSLEQQSASWDPSQLPSPQLAQNSQNPIPGSDAVAALYRSTRSSTLYPFPQQAMLPTVSRMSKQLAKSFPVKRFVCAYDGCNKAFKHSFILYRHQRDKHGASYIRPYQSAKYKQDNFKHYLKCGSPTMMPPPQKALSSEDGGHDEDDLEGSMASLWETTSKGNEAEGSEAGENELQNAIVTAESSHTALGTEHGHRALGSESGNASVVEDVLNTLQDSIQPLVSRETNQLGDTRTGLPGIHSFVATDGKESDDDHPEQLWS